MTENQTTPAKELPEDFTPCTAPGLACENPNHAHDTDNPEDNQTPEGGFLCNECGVPTHWDEAGDYMHDDPNAAPCFLIP